MWFHFMIWALGIWFSEIDSVSNSDRFPWKQLWTFSLVFNLVLRVLRKRTALFLLKPSFIELIRYKYGPVHTIFIFSLGSENIHA